MKIIHIINVFRNKKLRGKGLSNSEEFVVFLWNIRTLVPTKGQDNIKILNTIVRCPS